MYTFYRRLKKVNEAYLPVIKTSGDCFSKLSPQVPGLESGEDIGVLEQLCHLRSLGNDEILKVKNVNANVSEPVPPELEIITIDENQADGRSFGYNDTNVFNRILSKYNKYCCFAFKDNHVRKRNSRKKSAPLYTVKAECAKRGCPVTATIKEFDKSDMLNIAFEGNVIHPIGEYKARRRIEKEKEDLDFVLEGNTNSKTLYLYNKNMENIDGDSFGTGNLTGAGVTPNSIHVAASRVRKKHNTMDGIINDVLRIQSQLEEDDRLNNGKNSRKMFGYVHYPSISGSGIQIRLTDEALIRLYHFLTHHYTSTQQELLFRQYHG